MHACTQESGGHLAAFGTFMDQMGIAGPLAAAGAAAAAAAAGDADAAGDGAAASAAAAAAAAAGAGAGEIQVGDRISTGDLELESLLAGRENALTEELQGWSLANFLASSSSSLWGPLSSAVTFAVATFQLLAAAPPWDPRAALRLRGSRCGRACRRCRRGVPECQYRAPDAWQRILWCRASPLRPACHVVEDGVVVVKVGLRAALRAALGGAVC